MRYAIGLVLLFGLAVVVALFAGNNQGSVTLFWPPHRVDVSVNLALLILLGVVLAVHVLLQSIAALLKLPTKAREWRGRQKEHNMVEALSQGLASLLAGRYVRSRSAAQDAAAVAQSLGRYVKDPHYARLKALASWMAAESAHALQDRAARDQHVQDALAACVGREGQTTREGIVLRTARWALQDHDAAAALAALASLPPGVQRRTLALRLQLRAARLLGRSAQALDVARTLAKHKAFSSEAASSLKRSLAKSLFQAAHDTEQLQSAWGKLDPTERAMAEIACDAAARWLALGGTGQRAREWLEHAWARYAQLDPNARLRVVTVLGQSMVDGDSRWLAQVEAAQQANPGEPLLQWLAGTACWHRQLWGKAQSLLDAALLRLTEPVLVRSAATQLAAMAERRGDAAGVAKALQRALMV